MTRIRVVAATFSTVVAGILVLVVAVGSGSAKTLPSANTISVRQTSLGKTLVGAGGRTLYLFAADKPNRSTLSQAGFAVWPAFTSAKPKAEDGVSAAHVATIAGPGGRRQVTYFGHPLYYYVGDQKPGQTAGEGLTEFGALWYVLSPAGTAITKAPSAPAPSSSTGYAY